MDERGGGVGDELNLLGIRAAREEVGRRHPSRVVVAQQRVARAAREAGRGGGELELDRRLVESVLRSSGALGVAAGKEGGGRGAATLGLS